MQMVQKSCDLACETRWIRCCRRTLGPSRDPRREACSVFDSVFPVAGAVPAGTDHLWRVALASRRRSVFGGPVVAPTEGGTPGELHGQASTRCFQ